MEVFHVALNIVAFVNAFLVYLACKMLTVFKGGMMSEHWRFVCTRVLFLAAGLSIFSIKYLMNIGSFWLHAAGGLTMLMGGMLALAGLYIEYNWAS